MLSYAEGTEKGEESLTAGCAMVWVIHPRRKTVEGCPANEDFIVLRGIDTLDGGDVVEGFRCHVQDIFV